MLDKLRQKRALRQAADGGLEALLSGSPDPPAASPPESPAQSASSSPPPSWASAPHFPPAAASSLSWGPPPPTPAQPAALSGAPPAAARTAGFQWPPPGRSSEPHFGRGESPPASYPPSSAAPPPPPPATGGAFADEGDDDRPCEFSARGPCPSSPAELRECIVRYMCGSEAFGPLPISGVGLNAALRREFMRAGHGHSATGTFRSADTIAALRSLHRELAAAGSSCAGALALDDAPGGNDLLVTDINRRRLFAAVLAPSGDDPFIRSKRALDVQVAASGAPRRSEFFGRSSSSSYGRSGGGEVASGSPRDLAVVSAGGSSDGASPQGGAAGGGNRAGGLGRAESVDDLLKAPTAKQRRLMDAGDELRQLLAEPTTKQSLIAQKFMNKSQNMAQFCPNGSRADCRRVIGGLSACSKIHFKKIIKPWTDESLGDCSYLDTCRHIDKCKYVHYALDLTVDQAKYFNEVGVQNRGTDTKRINELAMKGTDLPAQWVHCDMRNFPLAVFKGLISVVMADPPWDIHMELPYGTLTDDEVRNLNLGEIHEDGVIFLWVTGRAMELARDCLRIWGYRRVEEIIWVKTNQLQRIIRTGRTGHWINHSKEHCLVGIKGNPKLNRNLDCDVIVSEVRETSRKPDEIYNLIERMFPNCMKLELFGRPHNVHDNWITCGNQLEGVRLCDEEIVRRYNLEFPNDKTEVWRRGQDALALAQPATAPPRRTPKPAGPIAAIADAPASETPWIPPAAAPPP